MFVRVEDGEKALWVTQRNQLPTKEWRIQVWLNTEDDALSRQIHERIAELVKTMMLDASGVTEESPKT